MALTNAPRQRKPNPAKRTLSLITLTLHLAAPAAAMGLTITCLERTSLAADNAGQKIIAIHTEGPEASSARADIEAVLSGRLTVVNESDTAEAMRKVGLGKPMGSQMTTKKQRGSLVTRVQKAAKSVGASAVIVGIVQRWSGKNRLYLVWIDADGEETPVDEPVAFTGSDDERRKAIEGALAGTIERFSPKPAAEAKGEEATEEKKPPPPKEEEEGDKPKRQRHEMGSAIVSIEIGGEAVGRFFDYSDRISGNLRSYDVFPAPMFSASVELYPGAMTTIPALRDIGLVGGYARSFALQSKTKNGDPVDTVYQRWYGALKYRIPISRPTGPVIGILAGVQSQYFHVDAAGPLADQVANVDYLAIRAGLSGWIPLGPVALFLGADWLEPLTTGEVYERFTGAKVHGIAGTLGLAVRLPSGFQLRLTGEYSRYFSDFDPVPGDTYIAGGALDNLLGVRLSAAYID